MRLSLSFLAVVALASVLFSDALASERPNPRVFGESLAFNTSPERISKDEIRKIADLGISNVRIGIVWHEVELRRGHYDWDRAQYRERVGDGFEQTRGFNYDDMISLLHELGFHMSTTLFYGNPIHTGPRVTVSRGDQTFTIPAAPHTPEQIKAFADFAAATAKHYSDLYGSDSFTWLIWNEPETDAGFPPETDADIVGQFITITCEAIKKSVPEAVVMAPAISVKNGGAFRYDFIEGLFTTVNPLTCLDGFTIHPYRPMAPETVTKDYQKLLAFLRPWQPERLVPLAVDEWGYPLIRHVEPRYRYSWRRYEPDEQAAIYFRMYLANFAAGLPLTILYEWRDSGPNPDYDEDNYGMLTFDGKEKPVIAMWRYIMPLLRGRSRIDMPKPSSCGPHVHMMLLGPRFKRESAVLVAWTETFSSPYRLAGSFGEITDIFGNKVTEENPGKGVGLSGMPLLIKIDGKAAARLSCLH